MYCIFEFGNFILPELLLQFHNRRLANNSLFKTFNNVKGLIVYLCVSK